MKYLIIALTVLFSVPVMAEQITITDGSYTAIYETVTVPGYPHSGDTNLMPATIDDYEIEQLGKDGKICNVYGHRWDGKTDEAYRFNFNRWRNGDGVLAEDIRSCSVCKRTEVLTTEWKEYEAN